MGKSRRRLRQRQSQRHCDDPSPPNGTNQFHGATGSDRMLKTATVPIPLPPIHCRLDLHGYREPQAIRAITDLLEEATQHHTRKKAMGHSQTDVIWVQIITGTGQHSNGTQGPILRISVQHLLQRRQMQFWNDAPGSFMVNACSGETWYNQACCSVDTKIVVTPAANLFDTNALKACRQKQSTSMATPSAEPIIPLLPTTFGPSMGEIAKEERDLQLGLDESLRSEQTERRERQSETNQIKQILRMSRTAHENEQERDQALLQQALALSRQQALAEDVHRTKEEEDLLQQAVEVSRLEQERERFEEEFLLACALRESTLLSTDERSINRENVEDALLNSFD